MRHPADLTIPRSFRCVWRTRIAELGCLVVGITGSIGKTTTKDGSPPCSPSVIVSGPPRAISIT
ncbi:MAG: hypothetical protein ACLTYW_10645 [Collinsella sp.]